MLARRAAILLAGLTLNASAADDSALWLAGLKKAPDAQALPAFIDLPASWAQGFERMSRMTLKDRREVAACLSVGSQARSQDRAALLKAYADLQGRRANMEPSAFQVEEKKLRQAIEGSSVLAQAPLRLDFGEITPGQEFSVGYATNTDHCSGESVGLAHTHPPMSSGPRPSAVPSERDILMTLYSEGASRRVSIVVESDQVCLMLPSQASSRLDQQETMTLVHTHSSYTLIHSLLTGLPLTPEIQREQTATLTEELGIGFYCGQLGQRLARIASAKVGINKDDPLFYLNAKALLIAAKTNQGTRLPIRFPFTPRKDAALMQYVRAYTHGVGLDKQLSKQINALESATPFEFYRLVYEIVAITAEDKSIGIWGGITYPDIRDGASRTIWYGPSYVDDQVQLIISDSQVKYRPGEPPDFSTTRLLARYNPRTRESWLSDMRETGPHLYYINADGSYEGPCKRRGAHCIAAGEGVSIVMGKYRLEGTFVDGRAQGLATMTFLDSKEVWKVRIEGNGFQKLERIK